jgi:excisionase family DNA binding protein
MRPVRLPDPWRVPVLTVADAADHLGISRATAYRAAAAGGLPTFRIHGRTGVRTVDLYEMLGVPVPPRPGPAPVVDGG